jgi:hypothetical protein
VGVQQGRPSDLTSPLPGEPAGPRPANEIGSTEDSFEVYRGKVQYPLDAAPLWRYMAKDALDAPQMRAVEEFRKSSPSRKRHKSKNRESIYGDENLRGVALSESRGDGEVLSSRGASRWFAQPKSLGRTAANPIPDFRKSEREECSRW